MSQPCSRNLVRRTGIPPSLECKSRHQASVLLRFYWYFTMTNTTLLLLSLLLGLDMLRLLVLDPHRHNLGLNPKLTKCLCLLGNLNMRGKHWKGGPEKGFIISATPARGDPSSSLQRSVYTNTEGLISTPSLVELILLIVLSTAHIANGVIRVARLKRLQDLFGDSWGGASFLSRSRGARGALKRLPFRGIGSQPQDPGTPRPETYPETLNPKAPDSRPGTQGPQTR